jgi:hypothetical protein
MHQVIVAARELAVAIAVFQWAARKCVIGAHPQGAYPAYGMLAAAPSVTLVVDSMFDSLHLGPIFSHFDNAMRKAVRPHSHPW